MYVYRTMSKGIRSKGSMKNIFFVCFLFFFSTVCAQQPIKIITGAERTDLYLPLLKGKRVAIVANHTSVIGRTHLVDSLCNRNVKISCIFAPEHGFRGQAGAGEKVKSTVDSITGLKVISLYGKKLKPAQEDLKDVDYVIFDIQDVGVRFYTYISTLQYIMEACADNNIPLLVLDRPNPNAYKVDGPVLEKQYASFVGMQSIPVMYGMTIGEYAKMLNGEKWLKTKNACKLKVIPLLNYTHDTECQLSIPPSPNLRSMDAIYLYPSLCFFEGTIVSVGRGTDHPFQIMGHPKMTFGSYTFTPRTMKNIVANPPYKDTLCYGMNLSGNGLMIRNEKCGLELSWLIEAYKTAPDTGQFFNTFFEKLAGTAKLREDIKAGKTEEQIKARWKPGIDAFLLIRKKYLLYN